MPALRHVVMSDLHLGALNSVLSNVGPDGETITRDTAAPTLVALGDCLRTLPTGEPPQLVVLGDMLELALTPLEEAAVTVSHFVRETGLGDRGGAFGAEIRYVAGNHDHYLWTRARTDHDLQNVEHLTSDQPLPAATHVTSMFTDRGLPGVNGRFVSALAHWAAPETAVSVTHSYPNFGLRSADGERAVVMHHGHFVEHLYRIVSGLDDIFDPVGPTGSPTTVHHIERDNGGWIDFFWSSEGDSGDAGNDVRMLYESLVSGTTVDAEIDRLADMATRHSKGWKRKVEQWLVRGTMRETHRALAWRERHHSGEILSADAEKGLSWYLADPVRLQLVDENGTVPSDVSFVFGHTHKPFTGTRGVTGYARPVQVVNTGGWVVDHVDPEPVKGASVVLVDDQLGVVSLELYRQRPDGSVAPPVVHAVNRAGLAFARQVAETVSRNAAVWEAFTAATSAAVRERRRGLDNRDAETRARLRKLSNSGAR